MEHYWVIKNKDIRKFASKWTERKNIILSEEMQTQKDIHGMYTLISEHYPVQYDKVQDNHATIQRPQETS